MVSQQSVQQQLDDLNLRVGFFGRPELRELRNILVPNETLQVVTNGFYSGGFAMLAATDKRILIIDKKPFILNIEDIRYEMVSEVNYEARVLDAQVCIHVPHKMVSFRSWHQGKLREMSSYIQGRVMETYTDWLQRQRFDQAAAPAPMPARPMVAASPVQTNSMVTDTPARHHLPAHVLHRIASRLAIKQINGTNTYSTTSDF